MKSVLLIMLCAGAAGAQTLSWYMQETAAGPDGRVTFLQKSWWPRAQALQEGQRFTLDLNRDGRPDTLITRKDGNIVEAIDDSGEAKDAAGIWDGRNTAYVVSLNGTGVVDRMLVNIGDEFELRHYQDGYLRYAWFAENYDRDGIPVFDMENWSYSGEDTKCRFRGNLMFYLNKYDPKSQSWVPLSECPFSFWDYNRDGHGDVVLRVSAAPLQSLAGPDADYANNYEYMWAPEATPLRDTGNVNVRFSFNIDPQPRKDPLDKPHYNFGFTMVGAAPYDYPGMRYTNPRRRPPQTVVRIPWDQGVAAGSTYPARETAFTWDEGRMAWRWEGQFWIFERLYLSNTGGPNQRWNMRREYSPRPSAERRIYYSAADKRYHLLGAAEGWLEAGYIAGQKKDLEFRWYDRDDDGYLDECQVYLPGSETPARVSRFAPRAHEVKLDRENLIAEYNERILPEAIAENDRFIAAMKKIATVPLADAWVTEAGRSAMPERKRYCLDIARELYFLEVRQQLGARLKESPYPAAPLKEGARTMDPGNRREGYTMGDSFRYWKGVKQLDQFVELYGNGRLDEAIRAAP